MIGSFLPTSKYLKSAAKTEKRLVQWSRSPRYRILTEIEYEFIDLNVKLMTILTESNRTRTVSAEHLMIAAGDYYAMIFLPDISLIVDSSDRRIAALKTRRLVFRYDACGLPTMIVQQTLISPDKYYVGSVNPDW